MKLRALLVFVLLGAVAASFASFELMLLAGNNGVHRYDPQSNVLLGRFAEYDGTIYDVAVDSTRPGEAVTLTGNGGVNRYDYSTGEFRGGFTVGSFFINERPRISVMANGNILYTAYTVAEGRPITKMYSSTGVLLSTLDDFGPAYQSLDSIQTSDGKIRTLVRASSGTNFNFYVFNYSSAGVYEGFATIESGSLANNTFGTLGIMNGRLWASSGNSAADPGRLAYWPGSITGTATQIIISSYTIVSGATNYVGGHNGIGYMMHSFLDLGVRKNRLIRYNPNINAANSTVFVNGLDDQIYGSAIVVAPEPGTMIALGLGLAAVVRRRKNSA
jgi:hypothetical protein